MAITRTAGTSHTYGWFVDGASQGTGSRMELLPQPSRHASLHSLRGPARIKLSANSRELIRAQLNCHR